MTVSRSTPATASAVQTETQNLYFHSPGTTTIRVEPIAPPQIGELQVRTRLSAISPGTEMLCFRGQLPTQMPLDATLPGLNSAPDYPLRYGYACVGEVAAAGDPSLTAWLGKRVFAFQPHTSRFNAQPQDLVPIPETIPDEAAALFPNTETAISLLHDSSPLAGERLLIFGQGIVGLITTWLLGRSDLYQVATVDPLPERRRRSLEMGAQISYESTEINVLRKYDPDLILELTGNPDALATAITIAGFQSRIIVGSWYGTKDVSLPLGQQYHRNRVSMYSSQVSTLPTRLAGRWTKSRRYDVAWSQLARLPIAQLITHRFPIQEAQNAYELIAEHPEQTCQVLLTYLES